MGVEAARADTGVGSETSGERGGGHSSGSTSIAILVVLGGLQVWLLSQPAPATPGLARLRAPEIALSVFDTVWLLLLALPRSASWPAALTRLAVGAPFHVAMAAACGASPGFHGAWAVTACAFAAVGTVGARAAASVHGTGLALLSIALPLGAYAAGEFGGLDVRAVLAASPMVGPTLLARGSATVTAGDAVPSLVAAALLLAADLAVSRRAKAATP